jgi:AcrR family transcriptional regulator
MPSNRSDRERDEKVVEILDLAESQLLGGGYSAMSVAAIARNLGIAANTIYWYFPSKDQLFVAVVERLMRRVVEDKPPHEAGLEQQALYFVDRLSELRPARVALHERAGRSELVASFEMLFREGMRSMLTGGLQEKLPADRADAAADAFLATVEGVLALDVSKKERDAVLTLVLNGLTAS